MNESSKINFEDITVKMSDGIQTPDFKDLFSEKRMYTFLVGAEILKFIRLERKQ